MLYSYQEVLTVIGVNKHMKQAGVFIGVISCLSLLIAGIVQAVDYGGGSVQGYAGSRPIDDGTIVQLTGEGAKTVEPATQEQMQNMFGVSVNPKLLSVRLSNERLENETFVAVSGTYDVLVSSEGGDVRSGDYLTMSSINGVAMKAGTDEPTVLGRAVGSFDGSDVSLGKTTLRDDSGTELGSVNLGSVPVTIDIKRNPNEQSTEANLPEPLKRVGQAIAEKEVSPVRIYLSMAITAVSLVSAIVVLYAGVRNGVISIGRNPMSKKSIFRALAEVILTSFLIVIIGLFAVYLLLRL